MERYVALASSSRRPDRHTGTDPQLGDPMFACHKTPDARPHACAGWLAVEGANHPAVRLAVLTGRLDPGSLTPGVGWPDLYASYSELAAVNGVGGAS